MRAVWDRSDDESGAMTENSNCDSVEREVASAPSPCRAHRARRQGLHFETLLKPPVGFRLGCAKVRSCKYSLPTEKGTMTSFASQLERRTWPGPCRGRADEARTSGAQPPDALASSPQDGPKSAGISLQALGSGRASVSNEAESRIEVPSRQNRARPGAVSRALTSLQHGPIAAQCSADVGRSCGPICFCRPWPESTEVHRPKFGSIRPGFGQLRTTSTGSGPDSGKIARTIRELAGPVPGR